MPCLPELPALVKAKYATDVNRWTALRRDARPARLLTEATGGDLATSLVWRDVLSRYQIADVASVVLADQHGCWGFLDLWRDTDAGPFAAADAAFLAGIAAPAGQRAAPVPGADVHRTGGRAPADAGSGRADPG